MSVEKITFKLFENRDIIILHYFILPIFYLDKFFYCSKWKEYIYTYFSLLFISISNKQLFYVNLSFEPFKLFESGRKGGSFLES